MHTLLHKHVCGMAVMFNAVLSHVPDPLRHSILIVLTCNICNGFVYSTIEIHVFGSRRYVPKFCGDVASSR